MIIATVSAVVVIVMYAVADIRRERACTRYRKTIDTYRRFQHDALKASLEHQLQFMQSLYEAFPGMVDLDTYNKVFKRMRDNVATLEAMKPKDPSR